MTQDVQTARFLEAYQGLDAEHQKAVAMLIHMLANDPKVRKMTRPDELEEVLKSLLRKPGEAYAA